MIRSSLAPSSVRMSFCKRVNLAGVNGTTGLDEEETEVAEGVATEEMAAMGGDTTDDRAAAAGDGDSCPASILGVPHISHDARASES